MKYLFLIVVVFGSGFVRANEISTCANFEVPVNYDANNFKYSPAANPTFGTVYHFLVDSIFLKTSTQDPTIESRGEISAILLANGIAIIQYSEGDWQRDHYSGRVLIKNTFDKKFETNWTAQGNQLSIVGVGSGQSAKCSSDGRYDLYFQYASDMGPQSIKGRKLILHYGFSTADPLKP